MDRILLIFGAKGELGKGISKVLKEKNYDKIYFFDRSQEKEIRTEDNYVYVPVGDLTQEEEVKSAFENVDIDTGSVYFLHSTVGGFGGGKSVDETSYEEWMKMQNLNLNISFLLAKYFAKLVKQVSGGSIMLTSAMTGLHPEKNKVPYGVSKSGIIYLIKTLALEGQDYNLTANAVAPFVLDTEENREWVEDPSILNKPEEIGELIHSVFERYKMLSGNIFELPGDIK